MPVQGIHNQVQLIHSRWCCADITNEVRAHEDETRDSIALARNPSHKNCRAEAKALITAHFTAGVHTIHSKGRCIR